MSEWISVKDRLPEVGRYGVSGYQLLLVNGWCFTGRVWTDGHWAQPDETRLKKVTHWMPLPPLP